MPRRSQCPEDCQYYHLTNRAIEGITIFAAPVLYNDLLALLSEAAKRFDIHFLAYAVMPNHWHFIVWTSSRQELSRCMHWLGTTHAQGWRAARGSRGRGAVYQGRFRSRAIENESQFLRACRYVERNPLRARLVRQAEDWPWSSASAGGRAVSFLSEWPVPKPADWLSVLNVPEPKTELEALRAWVDGRAALKTELPGRSLLRRITISSSSEGEHAADLPTM